MVSHWLMVLGLLIGVSFASPAWAAAEYDWFHEDTVEEFYEWGRNQGLEKADRGATRTELHKLIEEHRAYAMGYVDELIDNALIKYNATRYDPQYANQIETMSASHKGDVTRETQTLYEEVMKQYEKGLTDGIEKQKVQTMAVGNDPRPESGTVTMYEIEAKRKSGGSTLRGGIYMRGVSGSGVIFLKDRSKQKISVLWDNGHLTATDAVGNIYNIDVVRYIYDTQDE